MSVQAPDRPALVDPPVPQPPPSDPSSAPTVTAAATFLSVAAAAWMASGMFRGALPRMVVVVASALGVGLVATSLRTKRPAIVQGLVLPASVALGAALALPAARGAGLVQLVRDALSAGGLAQPPVPFDAGWRVIAVVVFAVLGAAAAGLAVALDRPKLGLALPIPVLMGAALVHPSKGELLSAAVATALVLGSLAVSFGSDLARDGASSGAFEARRLARGAVMLAGLVGLIVVLGKVGFLFPDPQRDRVIPPAKPQTQPPSRDRVLFTVKAPIPGPWRLGVLDVYDGTAWLLPPLDPGRLLDLGPRGQVPDAAAIETQEASFVVSDLDGGVLPGLALSTRVDVRGAQVQIDPRTQALRLSETRVASGLSYTITASVPPTGEQLTKAGGPTQALAEFLKVPDAPNEVVTLLAEAPQNPWDRLQFVRARFYEKVVAVGAGDPVDVPPARVGQLLSGDEATPYEITAAESLLARWAGVPARIGYGYYNGDVRGPGAYEVHPRHGATWLEAYFDGLGWVPIVGTPPRARSSLDDELRNADPNIQPTDELAMVVYVPVRQEQPPLLYVVVRQAVLVALPAGAALAVIWVLAVPAVAKAGRRWRRRRWASGRRRAGAGGAGAGPGHADRVRERAAAAYAEYRDACADLNVGNASATPLEFLKSTDPDPEHTELAWLVTRVLWADLTRDLRESDAEAAEAMARSMTSRLRRAQPATTRLLGVASRTSLREPYTRDVPNLWPSVRRRPAAAALRALRRLPRALARPLRRLIPIGTVLAVLVSGCASGSQAQPAGRLPERVAPSVISGFEFRREPGAETAYDRAGKRGLVSDGQVFTIRRGDVIEGSLQVASFTSDALSNSDELRRGVLESIATGEFDATRIGVERVHVLRLPEQRIIVWFAPSGGYFQLMVARTDFTEAEAVFADVLRFRRGETRRPPQVRPYDPRRGPVT
ncbi:MAG TPA: transglutaminaseTgpA domain-containing protein [Actinomycetota bacterium]|nr:transglutaminaseTgpA domain-containing protein [Actinomycetota bacterium]